MCVPVSTVSSMQAFTAEIQYAAREGQVRVVQRLSLQLK